MNKVYSNKSVNVRGAQRAFVLRNPSSGTVARSLAMVIALGFLATSTSPSHAGTKSQGTKSQGTKSQQTQSSVEGSRWTDEWLWGTRLYGVLSRRGGLEQELIEVVGFRGDRVDVLSWRSASGWRRESREPVTFVGMRWLEHRCHRVQECPRIEYRIRAVRRDHSRTTMPEHPDNGDVWLYDVESRPAQTSVQKFVAWSPVCAKAADGTTGGIFVDGHWHDDGSWRARGYTFSCQQGVIAKCVRGWGYKPWKRMLRGDGREIALGPLHRACVRAARADYCGDGVSYTRDGTLIDMFDCHGFNVRDRGTGFVPEAGFSSDGASWLQKPRYQWPNCTVRERCDTGSTGTCGHDESPITVWSDARQ